MLKVIAAFIVVIAALSFAPAPAVAQDGARVVAVKRKPAIVVTPRHRRLSANAQRHCEAELVQERRPGGTYIVPRTYCWWQ